MHTPLWIKIGMACGFAYLAIFSIDLVGDMIGGGSDDHGSDTHVADAGHGTAASMDDAASHDTASQDDGSHEAPAEDGHEDATPSEDTGHVEEAPVAALVGDAASGGSIAKKKCGTCHSFGSGDGHKVGPNLFNVIARGRGVAEGYRYSANLGSMGGSWSDADLDAFLTDPKGFVTGSKMNLKTRKEADRADLIAYLKTLQ